MPRAPTLCHQAVACWCNRAPPQARATFTRALPPPPLLPPPHPLALFCPSSGHPLSAQTQTLCLSSFQISLVRLNNLAKAIRLTKSKSSTSSVTAIKRLIPESLPRKAMMPKIVVQFTKKVRVRTLESEIFALCG